jgi:hypothetical protein
MRMVVLGLFCLFAGGCTGEYIVTAPDCAGLAGKVAPVVVRLQRREFAAFVPPTKDACITFNLKDAPLKCARTDAKGYAAVAVDLPKTPGKYEIVLAYQDPKGDEAEGVANLYVLSPERAVVVVDMDSLPTDTKSGQRLRDFTDQADIFYLTSKYAEDVKAAHKYLDIMGYPDAAIVPVTQPKMGMKPEPGAHSAILAMMKRTLPNLRYGMTSDAEMGKLFQQSGLDVMATGSAAGLSGAYQLNWNELRLPTTLPVEPATSEPTTLPSE